MNTVLNSYGQLYGCPEILKKSYKFFCRGLDIRVPEGMEPPDGEVPEGMEAPDGEMPEGMKAPVGEMPGGEAPDGDTGSV